MPTKLQLITAMYEYQVGNVTKNISNWQRFLQSASRNYKLPFDEQILVHAQRPDATAILEFEKWNKQFGRRIIPNATGIAVIDRDTLGKLKLKHYFDISDTHSTRYTRPVPLWEMKHEYTDDIIETLEAAFGELSEKETFSQAILSAASNLVDDNKPDYLQDLIMCRDDSFLEELDEFNVDVEYTDALKASVSYMMLSRCGIDPMTVLEQEDFRVIFEFNTPNTVNALGMATSDIAEMGLLEIASTVLSLQRQENNQIRTFADSDGIRNNIVNQNERGFEDGSLNLQQRERVQNTQSDPAGRTGNNPWKIRNITEELSEKEQTDIFRESVDTGQTEHSFDGNRTGGEITDGTDNLANDETARRDGTAQTTEPNEMGGDDEQYPTERAGNSDERTDLQLNFPNQEEQLNIIEEAEGTAQTEKTSAFSISDEDNLEEFDHEAKFEYRMGSIVRFGTRTLEILSFDNDTVKFFDSQFPLITEELPRSVFDRRIAENLQNNHLQVPESINENDDDSELTEAEKLEHDIYQELLGRGYVVSNELIESSIVDYFSRGGKENNYQIISDFIENEFLTEEPEYTPVPGDRYELQGREFVVVEVNEEWEDVKLQDVTFHKNVGFPIFRSEKLEYIRMFDPIRENEKEPDINIDLFPNQHTEIIDGVEFVFSTVTPTNNDIEDGQFEQTEKESIVPIWEQKKRPVRANYFDAFPDVPMSERNNFIITDDNLGHGGAKTKFRANMDAIYLLHDLEIDGVLATPEQQEILSRYVGWGSLPQAFDPDNNTWADEFLELQTTLGKEEYESARASTLNAHYTSPIVIKAIYKAVENMGFTNGNILDPGCGTGNFQGLLPETMKDSNVFGIEVDPITGRIAQQLYQKNSIAIQGYENTSLPYSFFDLAVGNVPFGSYRLSDRRYDKNKFFIHDYFIAKTLDKVRPGGVIAFVTSKGTMDKQNSSVRKYIAQRAELLGAIRLPNTAFKANAGTEVTSDIIFLQKRDRIVNIEPDWVHLSTTEDGIPVNQYYADHPEMILGTMGREDGTRMYGSMDDTTCIPFPDRDLSDLLDEAIQNIHGEIMEYERDDDEQDIDSGISADPSVRNFSFTVVDEQIYFRENSLMYPREMSVTAQNRVKGMIEIRECVRTLIEYQTEDFPDSDIQAEQAKLNTLYDSYTKKYGLLNDRGNSLAFDDDSSYPLLCSLETLDEDRKLIAKADMFTRRTIRPHIPITHVDTASEALAVSLSERAIVDLSYMYDLTGVEPLTLIKELEGIIFQVPYQGEPEYVTANEYLSGNVREKLKNAREFAAHYPDFEANVNALEAVQPDDLSAAEISVRLGATWLPPDVVKEFMFELLDTPGYARWNIKVHYSPYTAEWNIEGKNYDRSNVHSYNTYGTSRVNAYKIIEESLNLRDVRIFDYVEDDDGKRKPVLNKKETTIAQSKQEQIKTAFNDWIWKDPERRNTLTRMYNDKFNSIRPREYDGSHIKFIGMNPEIALREHQVNAIARIIYGGNSLLAHEVGAGKTFEMVAAAMEMKRIGLCHKSMIVVPNHIIEQFAAEWLQLYPSSNILVSTKKDFATKNRKRFCGRIATGDYDAVIIGHSQFEKIPMSIDFQRDELENQIDELLSGIAEAKRNRQENFTVKQLEKSRKNLQNRLDKLNDQSRKDDVVTFEELGIDRLFVDESHSYKNLFLYTKMRNVGGIAQTEALKSSDMFMKCRYLDKEQGGRGVIFATGTPISNSMVELYSIQRYLQFEELRRNGLQHFDAWASTFGETVTAIELAPEGSGYRAKTRFAKFYNLPELMAMFRGVADIQTADMLNLPVPKANIHNIVVSPSDMQKEMVEGLAERAERVRNKMVESHEDNMLCITNDGRKLALDQRLMNPMLPDFEDSKANIAANNIYKHWEDGKSEKLTQLVFCDLSTPKNDGSFNVYEDIRTKLIEKGVPKNEIAFIHNADTEAKKKELFAKVRQGKVRVLMGSTPKMGSGTNVQDRLIAVHHLDVPWRPSDLAQRNGRIVRQGNNNPEVDIYRYVTEGTFDAYSYQLIENKQKFISQIMTSKSPVRSAEDVDEQALSYAEIKALATGNPLIIEKCNLEMQVGKLKLLKSSHLSQRYDLEDRLLKRFPAEIKRLTERIAGYERDITWVAQQPQPQKDIFVGIVIGENHYNDKKEAGNEILKRCQTMTNPEAVHLGEYRGFPIDLSYDKFSKEFEITLKGQLYHTIKIGTDPFGNFTRMDNAIEGFAGKLEICKSQFESTQRQMKTAKNEVDKPFPQETELSEKMARLNEVNITLNLDKRDKELVDAEPDEGESVGREKSRNDRDAR